MQLLRSISAFVMPTQVYSWIGITEADKTNHLYKQVIAVADVTDQNIALF